MIPVATLVIAFAAGIVLLFMWLEDRQRRYLLWWSVAHFAQAGSYAVVALNRLPAFTDGVVVAVAYDLVMMLMAFGSTRGALFYRTATPSVAPLNVICLGLFALILAVYFAAGAMVWSRIVALSVLAASCLMVAGVLWSKDYLERFTSALFGVRAVLLIYLTVNYLPSNHLNIIPILASEYTVMLSAGTVFMLILICYRRTQREIRDHLRLLTLSHEVLTSLQGVTSVAELGRRIIPRFVEQHGWKGAALYNLDEAARELVQVGYYSDAGFVPDGGATLRRPLDESLGGIAIQQRKVIICHDLNDPRLFLSDDQRRAFARAQTVIAVPLFHDGVPGGVLMLGDSEYRDIGEQELALLDTVSHVAGMSMANVQHLTELTRQARVDSLTGLGNRTAFHEFIAEHAPASTVVALFDLDRFKEINDTLGHGVGDQVLVQMARRLEQQLCSDSVRVYRLGGDEFVVVYLDPGVCGRVLAGQLLDLVNQSMVIDDIYLNVTASVGVVESGVGERDSHELLRCADLAMYQVKKAHEAISIYNEDIDNKVRGRVELLADIGEALQHRDLELYYQPLIDMKSGEAVGAEALVRWQHPSRGLLSAGEFMPYVETTDHIKGLTYFVIDRALSDLRGLLNHQSEFKLSLNLSTRNLFDQQLPDYLHQCIDKYQVRAANVQLEITETVLMTDPEVSKAILTRLEALGFLIALDDFGTGYSSLSYLAQFPIHVIKIDRSFVDKIIEETHNRSIVEATIDLSHRLGNTVTAEGIETAEAAELLAALKCETGQGYYYSPPLPLTSYLAWHQRRNSQQRVANRIENAART